jgi:hypothetical protein
MPMRDRWHRPLIRERIAVTDFVETTNRYGTWYHRKVCHLAVTTEGCKPHEKFTAFCLFCCNRIIEVEILFAFF